SLPSTTHSYEGCSHAPKLWIMDKKKHIAVSIILGIVVILSVVGNIMVIVTSIFYVRLRSLTNIFILNLALSDLLFTVGLPFWVCDYIWHLDLGDALCKVYKFFFFSVGFYSSVVLLGLMTVHRYMVVVHSLSGWKKEPSFTEVFICVWVISILASLPVTVHAKANSYSQGCTYSSNAAFLAIAYKEIIIYMYAYWFIALCYITILQNINRSTTNQGHETTRLAFTLVATYFVFWAPYNIMHFLNILNYPQVRVYMSVKYHFNAVNICNILALTRCCFNPLIYDIQIEKVELFQQAVFFLSLLCFSENSTLMQTTDEYWRYYGLVQEIFFDKSHITVSILLGIVVFLSLVGNILVIVTSIFYVRLRSLTNISILNLALSDLLFTVGLPFWVCDYIWHLDLGDALCKVYKFFCSVGFYSNVVFLVLMSVQHHIAMLHPFSGWNQELSFADVLICSWVISILAALPVIV
ncbi:chemokine XC receptor 1, partial [Silurus asotus]